VLIIDRQGVVLEDSVNALNGQAVPLPPQWALIKETAPLTVKDTPAYLVLGYPAAAGLVGQALGAQPLPTR